MKLLFNFFISSILLFFSCQEKNKQQTNTHQIKVVEAKGYIVPQDSITEPIVIPLDESKLRKVLLGSPTVKPTNTNIHSVGIPRVVIPGTPRICVPGKDSFLLPKTLPVKGKKIPCGIPEIVIAKDFATKDQNPKNFGTFSKLQGLKSNHVRSIIQDKAGNMWFGTDGGATKYDGKTFTNFTEKEGLINHKIRNIFEDKSGNIWFCNDMGVSIYDGKSFTQFTENEGLSNNYARCIIEDKIGNFWIGTNGGGVIKYNGTNFTYYTEKEGLPNNSVWCLTEDKEGNIWFGTDGGVSKFNGTSFINYSEKEGLSNDFVSSVFQDKSGNIWFGSEGGLTKYDGRLFTHFTDREGLSENFVMTILEDKSGNIWIATDGGGINKYDGKTFVHFTENEGIIDNSIRGLLEDKNGNIWAGSIGGGVNKYNGNTFSHFGIKEGLIDPYILSMAEDQRGNLWLSSNTGICKYNGSSFSHYTEKQGLILNSTSSIFVDKRDNLWIGSWGKGLSKYNGKTLINFTEKEGLVDLYVWSIIEDKKGNIWFATDGGVSKYDGKTLVNFTEKEGLSNNIVLDILEDRNGNLWFATEGGGATKYNGKIFTHFTEKEGLSNNIVSKILEDKIGNLWFSTNGGISKYDGKTFTHFTEKEGLISNGITSIQEDKNGNLWFGSRFGISKLTEKKQIEISQKIKSNTYKEDDVIFKNYSYSDGFLGMGVNQRETILESKDGTIWIGTNDRLTAYHPSVFGDKPDTIAPNIQLTSISLFNENIAWQNLESKKDTNLVLGNGVNVSDFKFEGISKWYGLPENLSLAYNNNYLTFSFTGITMNQPKNVKYQYKLDGIDDNWSAITNRTEAPYGNLPHGNYTFKVKAMNSEGYWSNEFNYNFIIRPPFWHTWWFRTLVGFVIIGSVAFYIKTRERKLKERQKELEHKIDIATEDIKEQKNIIEEKHKEITDSINYAERIQRSFLATQELLDTNLSSLPSNITPDGNNKRDYFVFFQPKDVVSGDFYWASKLCNGNFAIVTADSTGHGVPGAIMSILNISSLEKSVEQGLFEPADIFNHTRLNIINRLKKDGSIEGGKDGMDASLISFDFKNYSLTYAAANNPVWIVRCIDDQKELIELIPDKMPVGKHDKDSVSFSQHSVDLKNGDVVYALTDGFPDQFGGPKGKKFMSKNLKELLISISHLPMNEQKEFLKTTLNNWKGDIEQVDDVCLIGVRI